MKGSKLHIALGAILFLASGCGTSPDDEVVAKAGKLRLTRGELLASIDYASPQDSLTMSAIYIEDWRDLAALYQLALDENVDKEPETRMLAEKAMRQITVQRFVDSRMNRAEKEGMLAVDSAAVKAFYQEYPDESVCKQTEYALARYYASTEQAASRMQNALRFHEGNGKRLLGLIESLDSVYADVNRQSYLSGRDLKALPRLHLENRKMKRLLLSMVPGDISPVIKVHSTLFVVMHLHAVLGKGEKKSVAQAYEDIEELLIVEKQKQYYSTLLQQARDKYQ